MMGGQHFSYSCGSWRVEVKQSTPWSIPSLSVSLSGVMTAMIGDERWGAGPAGVHGTSQASPLPAWHRQRFRDDSTAPTTSPILNWNWKSTICWRAALLLFISNSVKDENKVYLKCTTTQIYVELRENIETVSIFKF